MHVKFDNTINPVKVILTNQDESFTVEVGYISKNRGGRAAFYPTVEQGNVHIGFDYLAMRTIATKLDVLNVQPVPHLHHDNTYKP